MTQTKRTILYIEDDPASRRLVERTLKHAGYEVLLAATGLEGIDMARSRPPDLILTDINLPDLSGREITTTLRADPRFRKTPIVALTAQGYGEQREMALAAGVDGYLTKPIDVVTLPEQVEYYFDGGKDNIEAERLLDAQTRYTQEVVARLEQRIRKLESANSELRKLDKMKDAFIQVTAHELRTPLTLVYGYTRLFEDSPAVRTLLESDPTMKTIMQGMVDGVERMQSIINEIVTISRIMTQNIDLTLAAINLQQVVRRAVDSYASAIRQRSLNVHLDSSGWPGSMRADGELLALTFSNLVGNAIKYTPDGKDIYVQVHTDEISRMVRVSVRDTGIGIDPADQQTIFERFHVAGDTKLHSTSKTAFRGGGLGLGLAICRGIVLAHAGRIWVVSEKCDPQTLPGSEFIVELPLNLGAGQHSSQNSGSQNSGSQNHAMQ